MQETYFTLVTDSGARKMFEALNSDKKKITITEFAVGDGGGGVCCPEKTAETLKNEVWRGGVNACYVSEESENLLIIQAVIPAEVGGFTIREMGVFDEEGTLIALCNTPDTQKVRISDGVVHEMELSMEIALSNTESIELVIDPNVVTATKKDIEDLRSEMKEQIKQGNETVNESIEEIRETVEYFSGLEMFFDETNIEDSFYKVFILMQATEQEAMTAEDVAAALSVKWNGESSPDQTAMSSCDVQEAVESGWNGRSSEDETALTAEEIMAAIK